MNGAGELVTVVVPSFEHAAHLEHALRSVAEQDGVSLELVVVDDASRDDSVARAERLFDDAGFADRFEGRLRLIVHESNLGAHAAINRGLREATGDWLTVLNSDDAFVPGRLRALRDALRERRAGLAFSRVDYVDEHAGASPSARESFRLRRHQDGVERFPSVGFACMAGNVAITSGNLFMTRALCEAVGEFDALRYCHDWDFLLRAVTLSEPVFLRRPLYRYRIHGANSYRALEGVAEAETEVVLRRFFSGVRGGRAKNPLAPGPDRWPGVFEYWMDRQGFWRYW